MPQVYCSECGTKLVDPSGKFCSSCGYELKQGVDDDDELEFEDEEDDDDDEWEDEDEDDSDSDEWDDEDDDESDDDSWEDHEEVGVAKSTTSLSQRSRDSSFQSSHQSSLAFSQVPPVAIAKESARSFWNTIFGKAIRWIAYLPTAFILLSIIEILASLFLLWLFEGDMRQFLIIGILLGGLFLTWPLVMGYVGVIILANKVICPSPRPGVVIFATLYIIGAIGPVISIFTSDFETGTIVTLAILKIVFFASAFFAVASVYGDPQ